MNLRMWMLDIAREQSPTLGDLRRYLDLTQESGYNAIGLYLEHRFAYPSTPWSHGVGCVTPEMILTLQDEYRDIQIVPFINLLGHFEGMIYTEHGKRYREETFKGLQACPSMPEFVELCDRLIEDTVSIFKSDLIHIGGDETQQLGACSLCSPRLDDAADPFKNGGDPDGKAVIYGEHFGPLARKVLELGRRPAVWGDMFLEHPSALNAMPRETLIFDWQYFESPLLTSGQFVEKGFEVVCAPAILTYNAVWCHVSQSEQNVRDHVEAARELNAHGVCVTTWECGLFGNYETLFPIIRACGEMLNEAPVSPHKDSDEAVSKPVAEKRITYNPTTQEPNPHDEWTDTMIGNVIMDSILMNFLDERGRHEITYTQRAEEWTIEYDGNKAGSIPAEQGLNLLRRLSLLSNIDPLKKFGSLSGKLSGVYGGDPFEFAVRLDLEPTATRMTLTSHHAAHPANEGSFFAAYAKESPEYEEWARLMSDHLETLGGSFAFGRIRSSLKCRLLLYANPFLAWMYHHEELSGEIGDKALAILDKATQVAPDTSTRGVTQFVKLAIDFVRFADQARQAYAQGLPGVAVASLTPCRQIFESLEKIAIATSLNIGGSKADVERCRVARSHVETVIRRIRDYGDGSLGYLPAFEIIAHPKFMPHDQACWWLINKWANE